VASFLIDTIDFNWCEIKDNADWLSIGHIESFATFLGHERSGRKTTKGFVRFGVVNAFEHFGNKKKEGKHLEICRGFSVDNRWITVG
jgi:hypothetical protein